MNRRIAITILTVIVVILFVVAVWRHKYHPHPDPALPKNVELIDAIPGDIVGAALQSRDINASPAGRTSVVFPGRDYDIAGGGADIGGSAADGFRFVCMPMTGDFDARVQITNLAQVVPGTRAGLMVRDGLEPGSRMIFCGATASDGYRFNYRTATDGGGKYAKAGTTTFPNVWVRLRRQGGEFNGYSSPDGSNWTPIGTMTLALPAEVNVGLAVCSHDVTRQAAAEFRNLAMSGKTAAGGGIISGGNRTESQPETRP
jgi:regulation of enolase protein 1 (concanavalin A-like superfamily)